jgi:uncharacterized membrane protein
VNKQGLYLTIINTFLGLGATLFLKDNAVVTWLIISLVAVTIIFIERSWLNEHLFRNRPLFKYGSHATLAAVFLVGLFITTEPMRKTSAIIASTTAFLNGVKSSDYPKAYAHLSLSSRQDYSLADFSTDHANMVNKIRDFTIDQVTFNKFDSKKAVAVVTSPFKIYGHETLNLELIKEEKAWRVILSRKMVAAEKPPQAPKTKKKSGGISNFLNSIF